MVSVLVVGVAPEALADPITHCGNPLPCARNAMAIAFDKHLGANGHGQIVMFGGTDKSNRTLRDTWIYDVETGAWTWQNLTGTVPCARHSARLAYDETRQETIMFGGDGDTSPSGGCSSSLLNDTWAWTGTAWSSRCGVGCTPPAARASFAFAWDGATGDGYILMHGGNGSSCSPSPCTDTEKWNGTNWTQVCTGCTSGSTSPGGRESPSMIYSAARGHVILTGGDDGSTLLDGSWQWNGSSGTDGQWQLLTGISSPAARSQHRMAYDENTQLVMLFGGCTMLPCTPAGGGTVTDDQFSLGGTGTWSTVTTHRPTARCCFGLVYASYSPFSTSHDKGIFLFGGADLTNGSLGDFYFYTGAAWCKIQSSSSCTTTF